MTSAVSRQSPPNTARATGKEYAVAMTPARTAPDAVPASNPMFQPALAADSRSGGTAANATTRRQILQRAVAQTEQDRCRDQDDVMLPGHGPRAQCHRRGGDHRDQGQKGGRAGAATDPISQRDGRRSPP